MLRLVRLTCFARTPRCTQAEKTVKSSSGFFGGMFGGSSDKLEDAAEKFSRAGNAYKAAKKCKCSQRELMLYVRCTTV